MRTTRPVLFYTIGLPGAGKTTLANTFSHWLGAKHLRGDKIGLELFRFPTYSPEERHMVYAEMGRQAGESLRASKHVLYDAAVNTRAQRAQLATLASQHSATAIGIWIDVPTEIAKKRAGTLRDSNLAGPVARIIPPHIFDQYAAAFEAPYQEENIIIVRGDVCFALQYRRLQRQLHGQQITLPKFI